MKRRVTNATFYDNQKSARPGVKLKYDTFSFCFLFYVLKRTRTRDILKRIFFKQYSKSVNSHAHSVVVGVS